ncbi:MAG: aconitase X [Pseudomonadota bacterium]
MSRNALRLTAAEQADLNGEQGPAAQWAMDLVVSVGQCLQASKLVPIKQAHLVGAYHSGAANLAFLEKLADWGAQVRVPTTLNASSADLTTDGEPCFQLSERRKAAGVVGLLQQMGCTASLTCAPYFLSDSPRFGDYLAWAESNAVLYANSVIGARTLKCPQYFDMACALTGRAPLVRAMTDQGRKPHVVINVERLSDRWFEDRIGAQLVGYAAGTIAGGQVALIRGVPVQLGKPVLQGLCAAAGVSGSMEMLHVEGSTPESETLGADSGDSEIFFLAEDDIQALANAWRPANVHDPVAVCIGTPHAGPEEIKELLGRLNACAGPTRLPVYLSMGRSVYDMPQLGRVLESLQTKGVTIIRDTCTYYGSLMSARQGLVLTNSVKWAAYATSGLGCTPFLATLAECADSALAGAMVTDRSYWRVGP